MTTADASKKLTPYSSGSNLWAKEGGIGRSYWLLGLSRTRVKGILWEKRNSGLPVVHAMGGAKPNVRKEQQGGGVGGWKIRWGVHVVIVHTARGRTTRGLWESREGNH